MLFNKILVQSTWRVKAGNVHSFVGLLQRYRGSQTPGPRIRWRGNINALRWSAWEICRIREPWDFDGPFSSMVHIKKNMVDLSMAMLNNQMVYIYITTLLSYIMIHHDSSWWHFFPSALLGSLLFFAVASAPFFQQLTWLLTAATGCEMCSFWMFSWIFEKTTMRGIRNYDIIYISPNTTISTPRVEVSYTILYFPSRACQFDCVSLASPQFFEQTGGPLMPRWFPAPEWWYDMAKQDCYLKQPKCDVRD